MVMTGAIHMAKKITRLFKNPVALVLLLVIAIFTLTSGVFVTAAEEAEAPSAAEEWKGTAVIGAAIAVAGSCFGAGLAIFGVGSSGPAAMVERPELAIWVLILAGLAEGVAIYGLLIAIMILGKI